MFRARDVTGEGYTVKALPLDKTVEILRKYNVVK